MIYTFTTLQSPDLAGYPEEKYKTHVYPECDCMPHVSLHGLGWSHFRSTGRERKACCFWSQQGDRSFWSPQNCLHNENLWATEKYFFHTVMKILCLLTYHYYVLRKLYVLKMFIWDMLVWPKPCNKPMDAISLTNNTVECSHPRNSLCPVPLVTARQANLMSFTVSLHNNDKQPDDRLL